MAVAVAVFSPTDLLHDVLPQGLQCDLLAVLGRDDHGVNPGGGVAIVNCAGSRSLLGWDAGTVLEVVLAGDLGLGVGPGPPQGPVTSGEGYLGLNLEEK